MQAKPRNKKHADSGYGNGDAEIPDAQSEQRDGGTPPRRRPPFRLYKLLFAACGYFRVQRRPLRPFTIRAILTQVVHRERPRRRLADLRIAALCGFLPYL